MDLGAYTQEFHTLTLRAKLYENEKQKLARYISGLRYNIQDQLTLVTVELVHKCYQLVLRIEEKQKRKGEQSSRGRGNSFRGRGRFQGRGNYPRNQGEASSSQGVENDSSSRDSFRGRRPNQRGRFGGRGTSVFTRRCYNCNQVGHQSFRCLEKQISVSSPSERRINLLQDEDVQSTSSHAKTADQET